MISPALAPQEKRSAGRSFVTSAVAFGAVLASYFSVLLLEKPAGLHANMLILAVAVSLMLGRRAHGTPGGLPAVALTVAVVGIAATEIGRLMRDHPVLGDPLFVIGVSGAIWIRRFGPGAARLGTLVTLPFVAILVTPALPGSVGDSSVFWPALVGAIAVVWVGVFGAVAARLGLVQQPDAATPPLPAASSVRVRVSTRMAAQTAVALGAAFVVGRALEPHHWTWAVLTAYVVGAGNRGRGDVVHKGVLRFAGAAAGTAAATFLVGAIPPGHDVSVVVIFTVLALASWQRPFNYAFWAAGVTGALALLYGYYGETDTGLLGTRLEMIVVGAVLAVAAAWVVMPVRTTDVLRRRTAQVLAALSDLLVATRRDPEAVPARHADFDATLVSLAQLRPTLAAHRVVTRRADAHGVDAIDALVALRTPVDALVTTAQDGVALKTVIGDITTLRCRIGRRTDESLVPATAGMRPPLLEVRAALGVVDDALITKSLAR